MKTKKKSILVLGCACAMAVCMGAGTLTAVAAEEAATGASQPQWFMAPENGEGLPACWTDNGDGSFTSTNTAFTGNLLLTTNENLVGDYSMEATFRGSNNTEVTSEINMGFTPWFQDNNNFVLVYMVWNPANKFNMINVQTICKINGQQPGWNDHWLDFTYRETLYQLNPTDEITMHVDKKLNAEGTADTYTVTVSANKGDNAISETPATIDFSVSAPSAATQAMAGLYACNDTVTVSNFKTQSLTQTGVYKSVSDGLGTTGRSTSASGWAHDNGTYTVNASAGNSLQNQAVLKNEFESGNYQISYTANCEGTTDNQLSILPLYRDENNYVRFIVNQTATSATVSADGKANGAAFTQDAVDYTGTIDWTNVKLSASKEGTTFTCFINDIAAATYTNAAFNDGAKVALGAGNSNVSFSSVAVETLDYVPYDWFSVEGFYASALSEESVTVTENEGKLSIELISSESEEEYTRVYKSSGMYNEVSVSGKFTAQEGASYGLYLSFTDKDNYVVALVSDKVSIIKAIGGTETVVAETELPAGFSVTNENTLKASASFASVSVELNGSEILTGEIASLGESETGNIGAAAKGGKVTIGEFAVDGFWPNRNRTEGAWTLRGRRIGTWTVGDTAITADGANGTDFLNTIATTNNSFAPADGFYVASAVTISQLYNTEWKTGLMPYYKDADNFVFVWLSQWSGNATTITMHAKLNGAVVGSAWRETQVAYTMKDAVNYIEIHVKDDGVSVYLNKSFSPVATSSFEGLGAMPSASYGLNILNTSAQFAQIGVSENRMFTETGKPTIEKISGTMVTEGKVGTEIRIPVFSATGIGGATADITLKVTGPDGNEVEIVSNRFTPDKKGDYTLTVTATDAWGNTVDEEHKITVSGGKGCGSIVQGFSSVGILALALAVVGITVALKKKQK